MDKLIQNIEEYRAIPEKYLKEAEKDGNLESIRYFRGMIQGYDNAIDAIKIYSLRSQK